MLNHFIQRFIKEEGLGIPCYTFLTDPFPPFWRGWSSPYIDRYFVPTDEALQALTATGVPAWRIERVSMPVRSHFTPATISEVEEFRNDLNLDDAATILINGGARGGGPLLEIYKSVRRVAADANILVVCGRNAGLRSRIERIQDSRTRAFGFVSDIHKLVAASDLVITKPGALTTFEALACRVPLLLTSLRYLMPQESGLFRAAQHYDFGFAARTLHELEQTIRKGPIVWNRKRESISQFFELTRTTDLIERIQTADVA